MKKILAFAGSTSSLSINKKLAIFAAENLKKTSYDVVDLRDFEMPLYSFDEEQLGFPEGAKRFAALLDTYDGFILSLAEHNGSYSAAFKNVYDWSSRINIKVFRERPVLLMSASPSIKGGSMVLKAGLERFPLMGAKGVYSYSFPSFGDNFQEGKIINKKLLVGLIIQIAEFEKAVHA
jgi:NAD(P)H-dependent FMN reductase